MKTCIRHTRDVFFPIIQCERDERKKEPRFKKFLGTGFLIGDNGFLMTATHVIKSFEIKELYALSVMNQKWFLLSFCNKIDHSIEDISMLKIQVTSKLPKMWSSFVVPANSWEGPSLHFELWGYSNITAYQYTNCFQPQLCYEEGYIVKRLTDPENPNPLLKGKNFFETNLVGYKGYSGSPIISRTRKRSDAKWEMIGIYLGDYTTTIGDEKLARGIICREDGIRDWLKDIDPDLYF